MQLVIAFALFVAVPASLADAQASKPLAITHVTVVDVVSGRELRDRTVLIRGHRIQTVAGASRVRVQPGTQVVDGRGRFLIPGLWDMHAHFDNDLLARRSMFPLFIANGITGARDMMGDCDSACPPDGPVTAATVHAWQRDIASGILVGPHLVAASALFEGEHPFFPGSYSIHSQEEAREKVRLAKSHGAAFIKVMPSLSREQYLAVIDESRRQGLYVSGHVPMSMSAAEVSKAGQRSIEHMDDLLGRMSFASCATDPGAPRAVETVMNSADSSATRRLAARSDFYRLLASGYNDARCQSIFATFVKNGTWRVPTLKVERTMTLLELGDTAVTADPRLRFMPPDFRDGWLAFARGQARRYSSGDSASRASFLDLDMQLVRKMNRAGVKLLAGTDESAPFVMPGFALHDELALLVQAGLSPLEALRTATINPARFFGSTESSGTIVPSKMADLVILEANPLADIHNTTRIAGVIANGRYFDRVALDRLLETASHP
jgi:imidazolonepropionase-like amidohydrolase